MLYHFSCYIIINIFTPNKCMHLNYSYLKNNKYKKWSSRKNIIIISMRK